MSSGLPWDKPKGNIAEALGRAFEAGSVATPEAKKPEAGPGSMLDYALRYAARGWPVFPLHTWLGNGCSCGHLSCASPGKHPRTRSGFHDATTDPAQIREWWDRWPNANIGVPMGKVSGVWALDVDVKNGVDGRETLDGFLADHGPLPETLMQMSGGGGIHHVFEYTEPVRNRGAFAPGLDVRGDGGYIAVEPSNHESGANYAWDAESDPLDGVAALPAPEWLLAKVRSAQASSEAPAASGTHTDRIPEGGRNNALASLAGTLRRQGVGQEAIEAALQAENVRRCDPPLPAEDVRTIAWSVSRYEPAHDYGIRGMVDLSGILGERPQEKPAPVSVVEMEHRPIAEREFLLDGMIPHRQTTGFYARGGTGKTLFAQQLMAACATGNPMMGLATRKGPALGVFCEDTLDELHLRQIAINERFSYQWGDLSDVHLYSRAGEDSLLMEFDGRDRGTLTPFWYELAELVDKIRPALLVVDTAADTFGGNENIRSQVKQFVNGALTRLALAFDCAVLLTAHPSAAGIASGEGTGGSTAWENSVRSRLYMQRDQHSDRITLETKKANYAATGSKLEFFWHQGALVPFANVDGMVATGIDRIAVQMDAEFMAMLDVCELHKQAVSPNRRAYNYAPKVIVKKAKAVKKTLTDQQMEDAMERLLSAGRIEVVGNEKDGFRIARSGVVEND